MEKFIDITLIIHATSGGIALLAGILAIATKKGSKNHILSGQVYFWSMLSVIVTGLIVGWYRDNIFLQTIAVFSFYMAFTGKRVLRYKKEIKPVFIDWFASALALAVALFMLYLVANNIFRIGFAGAIPMLLIFGGLLLSMSAGDLKKMVKRKFVKNAWLYDHISRMGGSFIATFTAFLLVNTNVEPVWVMWLLPTFIGTPMIILANRKWRKKLGGVKAKR
ncbi:MAG: hypothetical protein RIC95_00950 [Vicingaceae bacterium]